MDPVSRGGGHRLARLPARHLLSLPQSSALSAKSCSGSSPFPSHPGTASCCAQEGLERKLCLAALHHPPQELPSYVQPSNEELCEAFKKDPKDFADR